MDKLKKMFAAIRANLGGVLCNTPVTAGFIFVVGIAIGGYFF